MDVIVIGGGPAGMVSAITAAKENNNVIILEKMNSCGRKLLITGKGRCNITSSLSMDDFIKNTPGNGKFLYSCFQNFTNEDIIQMLKNNGVKTKEERGNRIFPVSDKSLDVLNAFEKEMEKNNVKVITKANVKKINIENEKVTGVTFEKDGLNKTFKADKVILATGGKSYSATGSTGDGYKLAEDLGHNIIRIRPSLVPLQTNGRNLKICKQMQGLSLRNVKMKLIDSSKNKTIYEDFGELLFTHFGVSGPTILSSSAHLLRYKNVDELLNNGTIKLIIDLKPALDEEKLNLRILRDFEKEKNKSFKNSLNDLLPKKMIDTVIELSEIDENKKVNEITKKERMKLIQILKHFEITISGFRPIEEAIITSGGISTKEINPKRMESKIFLWGNGGIFDFCSYKPSIFS